MIYTAIILCYDTVDPVQARPGFRYSILPRVTSEFEASTDQISRFIRLYEPNEGARGPRSVGAFDWVHVRARGHQADGEGAGGRGYWILC